MEKLRFSNALYSKPILVLLMLCFVVCSYAGPFDTATESYEDFVHNASKGKAVFVKHFEGPENLTGLIIKGLNHGSKKIIAWKLPSQNLMFIGPLIDAQGKDLTRVAYEYYLPEQVPKQTSFEDIQGQLGFFQFLKKSEDRESSSVVVVVNPSCSHCVILTGDLVRNREILSSRNIDLHIVPVGNTDISTRKAANILRYGPVLGDVKPASEAQPEDIATVEKNARLLVQAYPELRTPMVLLNGREIQNTLDALLEAVN